MFVYTLSYIIRPQAGPPPSLAHAPPADAFARPQDIRIGATVSVYGRQLYVYDCDDFTRQWLQVGVLARGLASLL